MDMLKQKSMVCLELPAVLKMLSGACASEGAKAAALALTPSKYEEEAALRLNQCSDAKTMSGLRGSPSFYGVRDVMGSVKRADMGGMLSTRELLDIAALLRAARTVKNYKSDAPRRETDKKTTIDGYFDALRPNRPLEDEITSAILGEDELSDNASPELARLRRQIRLCGEKIRETLNKLITSSTHAKHLQETLITMRGDRYVVPVKAEHRGEVPGIAHDTSSSGATVFIEPMAVVELNNEMRILGSKEKIEIERILMELSARASEIGEDIEQSYRALITLDLIFAKARLSYNMEACAPKISKNGELYLRRARHPLLEKQKCVPVDISLGENYDTLVVTGPNTGGKTVSLKTCGLLSLMAACGLHIPCADDSRVPVFSGVYADIGDEQSIAQSLSTFSSHMTNIVGILKSTEKGSLVLLDELGAGTDPVEGAALAIAIIESLREQGALIMATTHYAELKVYALNTHGVENASCEFDINTLRPTFRLLTGVPGRSNAFAISERLGLPSEIVAHAGQLISADAHRFEDVIADLEERRKSMENERQLAERARIEAESIKLSTQEDAKKMEQTRQKLLERVRSEADQIIAEAKRSAAEAYSELATLRKSAEKGSFDNLNEARAELNAKLNRAEEKIYANTARPKEERRMETRPVRAGDRVELLDMGVFGNVISPPDKDGNLTVAAGIMKVNVKLSGVRLVEGAEKESVKLSGGIKVQTTAGESVKTELDLRGMTSEEAILELDIFIDRAILSHAPSATVIHGKGTGALRKAITERLRRNKHIKSFRPGKFGEGETGVTIIEF